MQASLKHSKDISSKSIKVVGPARTPPPAKTLQPRSAFQRRQHQLENNQIQHIKLGFYESRLTASDYTGLCNALNVNKSLTAVEVGWELPRPTVFKILECVTSLPCLQSLALVGLTNLPRRLFERLVSKPGLLHLELRNTTVGGTSSLLLLPLQRHQRRLTLNVKMGRGMTTNLKSSSRLGDQNVSQLVNSFAGSIQSLHLVASDFEDEDFLRICEWTERRPQPLDSLGFAYSNSMSQQAIETLLARASCRQLDLTSCASSLARCAVH